MKLLDEAGLTKLIKDLKRDVGDRVKATYDEEDKEVTFTALNGDYLTVPVGGADIDTIYPVGSIYMSTSSTNPATLFGKGTWTQLENRFLLGAGNVYTAGTTGGTSTVNLTQNNLPNVDIYTQNNASYPNYRGEHQHRLSFMGTNKSGTDTKTCYSYNENRDGTRYKYTDTDNDSYKGRHQHVIRLNGGVNQVPVDKMPPFLVVYMWERTA